MGGKGDVRFWVSERCRSGGNGVGQGCDKLVMQHGKESLSRVHRC